MKKQGFTLIELLVTVAIIAILAAIALPNFLAAHVRSKVARCYADMRTIAGALEAYRVDNNHYPLSVNLNNNTLLPHFQRIYAITTPVGYCTSIPLDVFRPKIPYSYLEKVGWEQSSHYAGEAPPTQGVIITFFQNHYWVLSSVGPSRGRPDISNGYGPEDVYDPTNGTVSLGSPIRTGP